MSSKWSHSLRCPHQNSVYSSPLRHTRYMPCPSHSSQFVTRTTFGEQYRSLSSSLCSFLPCPVTSSLLGPNILLNTLLVYLTNIIISFTVSSRHPTLACFATRCTKWRWLVARKWLSSCQVSRCGGNTPTSLYLVMNEHWWFIRFSSRWLMVKKK